MGKLLGKTALITGAARGQGRSHALALAERGCNVLLADICADIPSCAYPLSTEADLAQTAADCEAYGVRVGAEAVDVRKPAELSNLLGTGMYGLGIPQLDFVLCNAGIGPVLGEPARKFTAFYDCLDVMVRGVHLSIHYALPWMTAGGAIVITGSTAARKGLCPNKETMSHGWAGYHAAKTACVGLMRYYAVALAERNIRVNMVHPCGVDTPMTVNDAADRAGMDIAQQQRVRNLLPVDLLDPAQVTEQVLHLLRSDAITGCELICDAGCTL